MSLHPADEYQRAALADRGLTGFDLQDPGQCRRRGTGERVYDAPHGDPPGFAEKSPGRQKQHAGDDQGIERLLVPFAIL